VNDANTRLAVAADTLLVRDVFMMLLMVAGFLRPAEAMALLNAASTPFDFVLTDVMMPGHTGIEVADHARRLHPGTPVLLMTGYAEDQLGDLLHSQVPRDVITKPFSGSDLVARISGVLRAATAPAASSPTR
jgi:DNA-binding response OmpR family regulator